MLSDIKDLKPNSIVLESCLPEVECFMDYREFDKYYLSEEKNYEDSNYYGKLSEIIIRKNFTEIWICTDYNFS